ncbi:MAG: substrate-binding domain-containing protein [Casimicrobiaceae bacterium]
MTDTTMHLISAGAAKGLVEAQREAFERASGMRLEGQFGAVGAMRELLDAGAPCDVLILTQAMLDELAHRAVVDVATIRPLGRVYTGVAVPADSVRPAIGDAEALGAALLAASAIYFPDPQRATAGIHFANTLVQLGIRERVAERLHAYPNGATAMRAMAEADDPHAIGCTQVTEILYTPGVALVGRLPKAFELSTVYAAGACNRAAQADAARQLVEILTGEAAAAVRKAGGFESV